MAKRYGLNVSEGEKKAPRTGVTRQKQALSGRGEAKRRAAVAGATRRENISQSKARGTYKARKSGGVGGGGFQPRDLYGPASKGRPGVHGPRWSRKVM